MRTQAIIDELTAAETKALFTALINYVLAEDMIQALDDELTDDIKAELVDRWGEKPE